MKKKRHLKKWVKLTLLIIPLIIVAGLLLHLDSNMSKDFIKDCQNAGYSYNYCLNHQ